jgi:hypothetical protein
VRASKQFRLITSFALAACASAPSHTGSASSSATTITADQIEQANVPTAYEVVDRTHPQWFHDPSSSVTDSVAIYINNQKLDGIKEPLRTIPAQDVALLEYLKPTDAVMRFGQDAKGGAIIVTRK